MIRSRKIFYALLAINVTIIPFLYKVILNSNLKSLSTIDGKHFEVKFISELSADNLASDDTVLLRIPKKVNSRLHLPPKVFFREATKSFHNVTYLLQPRSTVTLICSGHCVNYKALRWVMTIFVKSAAGNFERRSVIRNSWGAVKQIYHAAISTVFVIGKSQNESHNRNIKTEHKKYGDILQYNGPDDYSNIAVKTLAGMQWAFENLPEDFLYSSCDDDFLVDTYGLAKSIDENLILKSKHRWPEFPFICGFKRGEGEEPVREKDSEFAKWAISTDIYKWPSFPVYCHGGLYTTSVRVIQQIFSLSQQEPTIRLDDVWLTGVLRWKMGMPDTMVVVPKRQTGYHLETYKIDFGSFVFFSTKELMNFISRAFEENSVCKCSTVVTT